MSGLRGLGDVFIDRAVEPDEVRSALGSLLSLPAGEVAVVESYEDLAAHAPEPRAACLLTRLSGGGLPTLLSLFEGITAGMHRLVAAARLCQLLRCRCLVEDGLNNPYTFLLVDAEGRCRRVGVDVDRWDRDEYVIGRMAPCRRQRARTFNHEMSHKPYAFDWAAFERDELPGLLSRAGAMWSSTWTAAGWPWRSSGMRPNPQHITGGLTTKRCPGMELPEFMMSAARVASSESRLWTAPLRRDQERIGQPA